LVNQQDTSAYVEGRPADMITPSDMTFEQDMSQYLVRKRDAFNQAVVNYNGTIDWHRFGRALELPRAIASKNRQLRAHGMPNAVAGTVEYDHALKRVDDRVSELTEDVIDQRGESTMKIYKRYIEDNYRDAVGFAGRLSLEKLFVYRQALEQQDAKSS
jgi:hypothetical protein